MASTKVRYLAFCSEMNVLHARCEPVTPFLVNLPLLDPSFEYIPRIQTFPPHPRCIREPGQRPGEMISDQCFKEEVQRPASTPAHPCTDPTAEAQNPESHHLRNFSTGPPETALC